MKLRIKSNSIRLRLLRSEVEQFAANGHLSDEVRFGPPGSPALKYSLVMSRTVALVTSRYFDNEIVIEVPEAEARVWAGSEQVSLESEKFTGDDIPSILVEKDFVCVGRPDDPDRNDAYSAVTCPGK